MPRYRSHRTTPGPDADGGAGPRARGNPAMQM